MDRAYSLKIRDVPFRTRLRYLFKNYMEIEIVPMSDIPETDFELNIYFEPLYFNDLLREEYGKGL